MKKQRLIIILILAMILVGCENFSGINKKLEIKEMQAIAELATVECFFHNVATSDQKTDKSWYEFWKKENMKFWVEYEGVVRIGIDASLLSLSIEGEKVKIQLPPAQVLDVKVNESSLTSASFYYDPNSNRPDANQQIEAYRMANDDMKQAAENDRTLLANARENVKELLENYVKTIAEATGIQYSIEWVYMGEAQQD